MLVNFHMNNHIHNLCDSNCIWGLENFPFINYFKLSAHVSLKMKSYT